MCRTPRLLGAIEVLSLVFGLGCSEPNDRQSFALPDGDLRARCEVAPDVRTDSRLDQPLRVMEISRLELPEEVGRAVDVVTEDGEPTMVLDAMNSRLARVGLSGTLAGTVGQPGDGPGDISLRPPTSYAGVRIRRDSAGRVFLADRKAWKVFDARGQLQWSAAPAVERFDALHEGLHVADAGGDRLWISEAFHLRFADTSFTERMRIAVRLVRWSDGRVLDSLVTSHPLAATADSSLLASLPPYQREFRRVWDANARIVAVYAAGAYRVCFFSPAGDDIEGYERRLPVYTVDEAERSRVMTMLYGTEHDSPLPFVGVSARELMRDRWPTTGPRYTDIVLNDGTDAWLRRRVSSERVAIDVFRLGVGYVGTFTTDDSRLPRVVHATRGITLPAGGTQILTYEWRAP
jgi:hypothetical protein